MTRRNDSGLIGWLFRMPWWAWIAAGIGAYLLGTYPVPGLPLRGLPWKALGPIVKAAAPYVAAGLILCAPIAWFRQRQRRRLPDGQRDLDSIRALRGIPAAPAPANQAFREAPTCHVCSRPMVQRIERHGFKRDAFWACSGYPHCKGNRPLQEAA